jgi:uncharacterized protein YecE (DUF72 family)
MGAIVVGTAGWSIPRTVGARFPGEGTHLQRYARVLPAAEINSSFHRPHAPAVYARWAASTPSGFRFAVKVPRTITHDQKLRRVRAPLERFLDESAALGSRRGPLLVQLPPSFAFDARVVAGFLDRLRALHDGPIVCEPRHATWFEPRANEMLVKYQVARVAADPPPVPAAAHPGGWSGLVYYRLHGSPRKYWSSYEDDYLRTVAAELRAASTCADAWCVFDNTASGAAVGNALALAGYSGSRG